MSRQQLQRIVIALVVLVFLWGVAAIFGGRETDELETLAIPTMTESSVDTIVIDRPGDTVVLARSPEGAWEVNGFRAAPSEVRSLFDALTDSSLTSERVARSAESHVRMGIDSAQGRRVTFRHDGATVAELVFGDRGRRYRTGYVRRVGEDDVYLLRGGLHNLIDRGVDAWRDREIAAVDTAAAARIELRRGGGAYTVSRADGSWQIDGRRADSLTVSRILMELAALRASGFPTAAQLDSIDFGEAERRIAVLDADGNDLLRVSFDSAPSWFWAQPDSGGPVFRVDRWRVDRLVPADTALQGGG